MQSIQINIDADEGLHARPAHVFCTEASKYQSVIQVRNMTTGSGFVNAKSILMILTLGVIKGNTVEITCEGPDEAQAAGSLKHLIASNFPL
jgi:phosphocarrier protein HPr